MVKMNVEKTKLNRFGLERLGSYVRLTRLMIIS